MGRKKKVCKYFDKDAPKNKVIQFRINTCTLINIERMKNKLGVAKAEIFRTAMEEYYKTIFPNE